MAKGMYPCWACGKHLKKGELFEQNTDMCPRCVKERDSVLAILRDRLIVKRVLVVDSNGKGYYEVV